jgi:hypothetical protein
VPDPDTGVVERADLEAAVLDGIVLLDRAGGVMTVLVGRQPTNLPGEMVTTQALVEWRDRTDAREQPERAGDIVQADPAPAPADPTPEELEAHLAATEGSPDGFVPQDEEDISEIPTALR